MAEVFKQIFVVVVGVLLIANGLMVIKKGRFEIGIGGRATARPLIALPIKGIGAITFGIFSIISGLIVLLYIAIIYIRQETALLDTAFSIGTVVIIGLLGLGLIIGFILQTLLDLIAVFGKNDKNSK